MIISGYEKPVEYGRQQIFDPTMAAMVLQSQKQYNDALKDEYERGLKQLDDFYKNYGDFLSPFEKDMKRYGQMIGGIRGALDEAYANNVDLLGSPEGRMLISRLTNAIDPSEFNLMRTNAKLGFEYLDAIEKSKAKNEFNQAFEDWSLQQEGGPGLFNDFSSAKGMWNRPAPYVYQDLNQFTNHIFDKMDDSYIDTIDGYDYYGVSREARQQALTQHLAGLMNTQLGQFHYQNSKAAYESILGRPLSDDEAMAYWQRDILDSTQEFEHRNRKLNEMWKLQYEDASRQRAARTSAAGRYQQDNGNQWSFIELVKRSGSTAIVGQQPQEYSEKTLAAQRDAQIEIGNKISTATGGHSGTYKGQQMFKQVYGQNQYSPEVVADFIANSRGYQRLEGDPTTLIISKNDLNKLHSLADVSSHTTGYRGATVGTNNSKIAKGDYILAKVTGGSYQGFMKDAVHRNHFTMQIKSYKKKNKLDNDGNLMYDTKTGQPITELVLVANGERYFDSDITSTKNDPRAGYLGTKDKKTGKINSTKGIPVTNTQDRKYQNAINADKVVSDKITKGTIYGTDATLTELGGFAQ